MKQPSQLFVKSFNHEAHNGLIYALNMDQLEFRDRCYDTIEGTIPGDIMAALRWPDYDIYLIEGSPPLYAAFARKITDKDATIIYLGGDRGMYAMSSASEPTARNSVLGTFLEQYGNSFVRKAANYTLDGAIVVSDFVADYTRAMLGPDTPIRVAHPFIQSEVYDALGEVNPTLDSKVAVTIGRAMDYKGTDRLVESWPRVRDRHPDAELYVIGPGDHPEDYTNTPGVTVKGFVENLADAFEPASLCIQPSRGDAFAISVVEAMRAGVPALTTMTTGARSEARAVDDRLVVDSSAGALAEGVCRYFDLPLSERRSLSARARERGARFDPESRKTAFKREFESLLAAIDAT